MTLSQRIRPFTPQANRVWRFYSDTAHLWRWQRLASDGTVVEHSKSGYRQYESCLSNANEHDYEYLPSITSKTAKKPLIVERSSKSLTPGYQKVVSEDAVDDDMGQMEGTPTDEVMDDEMITPDAI